MKVKVRFQEEYILAHILKSGVFGAGLGESKLCEVSFAFFFFFPCNYTKQQTGSSQQRLLSNTFVEGALQP